MGRPLRNFHEGLYHVAPHASDTRALFRTDDDRRRFLDRLESFWKLGVEVVSYALMTNHYHAIVWTPDDRLSRALQGLHGGYSLLFNGFSARTAHLFRGHCPARRIDGDDPLVWVARYVARNPVEAGLAASALEWPWSSAAAHAGLERSPIRLAEAHLARAFGAQWRETYAAYVS